MAEHEIPMHRVHRRRASISDHSGQIERAHWTRDKVERERPGVLPSPQEQMTALTVLQPMSMYRALQQWCSRAGIAAGTPDLSPHDVVHALVLRLLADPDLAADVTADLKEEAQARAVVGTFVPAGEAKRGTSHRAPGSRR